MFIRDPLTSHAARVAQGRLRTQGIQESLEADASRSGDAFTLATSQSGVRSVTVPNTNVGPVLYIRNLSESQILVADGFTATENGPGGVLYLVKNPILGTIGANVPITAANRNFSSTTAADVEAHVWDEVGGVGITGLTGGEEVASFLRPVPAGTLDLKNAVRLGRLDSAYFGFENNSGGALESAVSFRFHMEDIEVFT